MRKTYIYIYTYICIYTNHQRKERRGDLKKFQSCQVAGASCLLKRHPGSKFNGRIASYKRKVCHSFLNVSKTYIACQCVCVTFWKGWLLQCLMIPTRKRVRVRVRFVQLSFKIESTHLPFKAPALPKM